MKKLLFLPLMGIIIVIIVLGYAGILPGISSVLGTDTPKDLKIRTTTEDLQSGNGKTQTQLTELPDETAISQSLRYEGSHEVKAEFTSEEITALANNSSWKYNPISQVQIRFNPDGSAEASGYVDFDAAKTYALALGVSSSDIEKAIAKFPIPHTKFPFYVKASGDIQNNTVNLSVSSLRLANIPVPQNIVNTYLENATSFLEQSYLNTPSINIESLRNVNGTVQFTGTLPDKELTVR